jgi:hypothetical protein
MAIFRRVEYFILIAAFFSRGHTLNVSILACVFVCSSTEQTNNKESKHFLQNQPIILQDNARAYAAQALADLFDG